MAMNETLIDLLRHGEPVGGVKFRGHTDDPLSEQGWAQMRAALRDSEGWERVVCSPLRRCAEFAQEQATRLGLPCETEPRFREIGFGDWEGRTIDEIRQSDPERLERLWRDPARNTPPGGERLEAFVARVTAGWSELLTRHEGKKILLVAHGGVNRAILCQVLQIPIHNLFRLEVPFAGRSRVRVLGSGADALPLLVFHGHPQL